MYHHLGDATDDGKRRRIHLYRRDGEPRWLKCRVTPQSSSSITVDVEDADLLVMANAIDAEMDGNGLVVPLCRCNGPSRPPSLRIKLDRERTAYFRTVGKSSYYTKAPPPSSPTELAGCELLLNVELTPMWRTEDGGVGVSMLATEVLYRPPVAPGCSHVLVPCGGGARKRVPLLPLSPREVAPLVTLDNLEDI